MLVQLTVRQGACRSAFGTVSSTLVEHWFNLYHRRRSARCQRPDGTPARCSATDLISHDAPGGGQRLFQCVSEGGIPQRPERPRWKHELETWIGSRELRNFDDSWKVICQLADLKGLRIHDCRHSFASRALALG